METTTHRGWWPALEPALLAFAVVVCGSVSLLAVAHAAASDGDHHGDVTRSSYWTAAAADQDPLDDGDDDDAPDGFVALPIVLTSDDGFGRLLIQNEFDVAATLRTGHLVPRGPPDWMRTPHHSAPHPQTVLLAAAPPLSRHWTAASHDSVDDGDDDGDNDDEDDGGADDVPGAIAALTTLNAHDDSYHPVVQAEFGVALAVRSESVAPRGPPVDRNLPACDAHDSDLHPRDSSDIDVSDSDDDDDDGGDFDGFSVVGTCGRHWTVIVSEFHNLFSSTSRGHSLRAPPQ